MSKSRIFRDGYPFTQELVIGSSDVYPDRLVGLTGLEPVTLRLSSACSNQLSYRPISISIYKN